MPATDDTTILQINTVQTGFYEGFNPMVSMVAKLIILSLVIALLLYPAASENVLDTLKTFTLLNFGSWYVYLLASFVALCAILVVLPVSGRIKLGADSDIPEHSTLSWLSMMFCSGIGVGILVFSVSEPISHFSSNPDILGGQAVAGSPESVASAFRFVFLHWGFSAWACYAIVGMALGLSCYRNGQPMTMRSAVEPLFGRSLDGVTGHLIDVISILAIIAGITTTIVLGLEQICSGLSALTGSSFFADQSGNPPLIALTTALLVAISIAIASVVSGVDRGVKWISNTGLLLAFAVLCVFAATGSGIWLMGTFFGNSAEYLMSLPRQMIKIYDSVSESAQTDWQSSWTIFYWAWWIAFAPFVGLFLARISRGRTLREFILGSVLGPTVMCFLWFSVIGGSAVLMEMDGTAQGSITQAPHAFRIYETINLLLSDGLGVVMKTAIAILFLALIVASTTAAIIAIKSIGAAGGELAETPLHSMTWAVVIAAITGAVMSVGGVESIRDVMVVGAVPFSAIMALMLLSVIKMIWTGAGAASVRT